MAVRTADIVEPFHRLVDIFHHAVEPPHLVEDAGRSAFLAGTVVRHDDEERVVELAEIVKECHQPTDLRIRVIELRREGFLQPGGESLFIPAELVPRPDARVQRCEVGVRRDDAELLLTRIPIGSHRIPARIELASILVAVGLGRLVG